MARELRGTRISHVTSDSSEKKILNVVEELAIAAGTPAPDIFVLEDDRTINAFAAGKEQKDYVIGVTRGAIDRLSRSQLQAVMAHEFSHIINGDTKLNLRLIGMLAGVQMMARFAALLLNMGTGKTKGGRSTFSSVDVRGQLIALVLGTVVYPVGALGELCARLVKLAVNRQREFLADASAVELTRDPVALCEALHLIAHDGSRVSSPHASLVSHIFFADVSRNWLNLFDTHPPITERIRRLDPEGHVAPPDVTEDARGQEEIDDSPHSEDRALTDEQIERKLREVVMNELR